MRDLDENPYSPDEARVAKFFADKGTGGGDDPIGFILASYEYLIAERNLYKSVTILEGWKIDPYKRPSLGLLAPNDLPKE